jgi:hypothetical protein
VRSLPIVAVLVLVGLLVAAAPASADTTIETVARPTPLSAFGGRLVWSQFDPATGAYLLMTRANGVTSPVPVRPRSVPFDVDLGPSPAGDTLAVYSRCARDPRAPDPRISNAIAHELPNWRTGRRCDLFKFNFASGTERRIKRISTRGASEFLPSIWQRRIAFSRVYEKRRGRAGKRAYLYVRLLSLGRTRRLRSGPRSRLRFSSRRGRPGTLLVEPGPTALDLVGPHLAFAWDWGDQGAPLSDVRLDRLGRRGRLVQRAGSGEIQAIELISPTIAGGRVNYGKAAFGNDTYTRYRRYETRTGVLEDAQASPDSSFLWTITNLPNTIFSLESSGFQPGCEPSEDGGPAGCAIVQAGAVSFVQIDDGGRRCARRRFDFCFLARP